MLKLFAISRDLGAGTPDGSYAVKKAVQLQVDASDECSKALGAFTEFLIAKAQRLAKP